MADIIVNRPNFLYSEEGKVLKSVSVYDGMTGVTSVSETDASGYVHKTIKAGTIYTNSTNGLNGLIYEDVDVSAATADDQAPASLLVAGHYINDESVLPTVVSSANETVFKNQGLFGHKKPVVTRPDDEI